MKNKKCIESKKRHQQTLCKIAEAKIVLVCKSKYHGGKNTYQCEICKRTFEMTYSVMKKLPHCPKCQHKGNTPHNRVKVILEECGLDFEQRKTFEDLTGVKGGRLRFDFYIKPQGRVKGFLLEIDAVINFKKVENEKGWTKNTKEHDQRKDDFALRSGIRLYRIKNGFRDYEKIEMKVREIVLGEMGGSF